MHTGRNMDMPPSPKVIFCGLCLSAFLLYTLIYTQGSSKQHKLHQTNIISRHSLFSFHMRNHFKHSTLQNAKGQFSINKNTSAMALYHRKLKGRASAEKVVILAFVDDAFVDMAINFYETSLLPFMIENYLFISWHRSACEQLLSYHISCYVFQTNYNLSSHASGYGSKIFHQKMALRTGILLETLRAGYKVLHTDVDVVFLKNPMKKFTDLQSNFEVLIDCRKNLLNAGFIYLRPTGVTIRIYQALYTKLLMNTGLSDQDGLNRVVKSFRGVVYRQLNKREFVCGADFFENRKRYFGDIAEPCPSCVVVHNNWIVSKSAKVYRFKEMLMWRYEGTDGYYSNPDRLYIMYDSPPVGALDLNSLGNALAIGGILNRTVILPRFHCHASRCPLNSLINIAAFDKEFGGTYRESTFLKHPKVPQDVSVYGSKINKGAVTIMPSPQPIKSSLLFLSKGILYFPKYNMMGATESEIIKWFAHMRSYKVLHFSGMHKVFGGFSEKVKQKQFEKKIKKAFRKSNYRQF